MPTISVIVPVYKVESYLDRCVQSVLDQTFKDYELILVDDGSPDRCGAMCDEWAEKDCRIRVIHKENGGLSDARNAGIDIAQGQWLTFIDSDDYIHTKMLEALYHAAIEHDVKVSICGYAETNGESLTSEDFAATIWAPADFYRQHNVNATVAWGKLYHKDVVLPYPVGKLHEDEYVTYRILFALDQIAVVNAPMYAYFQNEMGITGSQWSPKRMDIFHALEQQISFFESNGYRQLALIRVYAYERNVCRQLEQALHHNSKLERWRSVKRCRGRIRYILKKYKNLAHYNLLDHQALYEHASPGLILFYRIGLWLWCKGSQIKQIIRGYIHKNKG